ncbi:hypothetical protein [Alteromonas sp. S167]|uniref:hypothetical protein n=1 Tax=Alteromonas sp. S167 TaxID=3117402 RepID=UPI002FE11904
MRLPTQKLINKIEHLSKDLSPSQLTHFLDIIDAMTALVEEAGTVGLDQTPQTKKATNSDTEHSPANALTNTPSVIH